MMMRFLTFFLLLAPCLCFIFDDELTEFEDDFEPFKNESYICGYCLCDYLHHVRSCANLGLKTFPADRTGNWSWVVTLDLSRNNLTEVPDLHLYENLKYLNLSFNAQLDVLGEKSFDGLVKLEGLDLSDMGLTFENGTIHSQVFEPLRNLTILRMKQQTVNSSDKADYFFLLGVKNSLRELNVIGHPNLVPVFEERFPHLQNVSLGGNSCDLTGFFDREERFIKLRDLQLIKLSLRNCLITIISADYFKPLARTLEKLDISCNPVQDSFLNIAHAFRVKDGTLNVLIADHVNQNTGPNCDWNITGEMFIPSLQIISIQGNSIAHFIPGNSTNYMKHLKYIDVSYNTLGGSAFNTLRKQCTKDLFWCNLVASSHQLKYIGASGITHNDWSCRKPEQLDCSTDSELYINDEFEWENVTVPDYLDVFIILDFLRKINNTFVDDINALVNSNFSASALPADRAIRILFESVERHPETGISLDDILNSVLQNITVGGEFTFQVLRGFAKFICDNQHVVVLKETLTIWVNLVEKDSVTWSNESISNTVEGVCKHKDWNYGVDFVTDDRYRIFFTNLTTVVAQENSAVILRSLGPYCNNVTYFYNNMRSADLSGSELPLVACSNTKGWEQAEKIVCRNCRNKGGWTTTAEDLPNLRYFDWSENYIGELLRDKVVFKGFKNLEVIKFDKQQTPVIYFRHRHMFSDQRKLLELHLRECGIEIWNISLSHNSVLKELNLHGNKIQFIDEPFRDDLIMAHNRSGLEVNLSENPTGCACDPRTRQYINWLLKSEVVVKRNELKCSNNALLIDFVKTCHPTTMNEWIPWKIIAVTAIGFAALAVLTGLGFMARKVVADRRRKEYEQLPNDSLPRAIISYSPQMMNDINALKDMTKNHFHLLSFDYEPGAPISSGFPAGILKSESGNDPKDPNTVKIILVVSDEYFCQAQTTSQQYRLMNMLGLIQKDKVILILTSPNLEEVKLQPVLNQLYKAGKFLVWPSSMCCGAEDYRQLAENIIKQVCG